MSVNFTRAYRIEQITNTALSVPGVAAVETWIGSGARRVRPDGTESPNIRVLAPPADTTMINPRMLSGRWLDPADENAIVINSIVLEEDPDIVVGDTLRLKFGDRESDWLVVGIAQGVLAGPNGYVNYPYFAREHRFVGRAGQVQVSLDNQDAANQQQMATLMQIQT